jgi:glyoxylase-like metal-dependent hydrolase (beta-lactamase superfamily II)
MRRVDPTLLLGQREPRVQHREIAPGITQWLLSTAPVRAFASAHYRVDDALVDSGYPHVATQVLAAHEGHALRWVALTHLHEDHSGNAAALAARAGCPVYLRRAALEGSEGTARVPLYRRYYWGQVAPYDPVEMPRRLETSRRTLRAVPTPGHSRTHSALFDEESGTVFTGDLYVASGAAAVMRHENPFESVASLRRVADLSPARLAGGHGGVIDDPAERLRLKADRIEETAGEVLRRHDEGWTVRAIQRDVFHGGPWRERTFRWITGGEFSERNFVRAVVRHRDQGGG